MQRMRVSPLIISSAGTHSFGSLQKAHSDKLRGERWVKRLWLVKSMLRRIKTRDGSICTRRIHSPVTVHLYRHTIATGQRGKESVKRFPHQFSMDKALLAMVVIIMVVMVVKVASCSSGEMVSYECVDLVLGLVLGHALLHTLPHALQRRLLTPHIKTRV